MTFIISPHSRTPRRPKVPVKPRTAGPKERTSAVERDPVDVYCRIRPVSYDTDSCLSIVNKETLQVRLL